MRAASGSSRGMKAGARSIPLSTWGSMLPVRLMVEAASSRPSSSAPESPMKIRAGCRLCGRNPRQAPIVAAVTSEAVLDRSSGLELTDSR